MGQTWKDDLLKDMDRELLQSYYNALGIPWPPAPPRTIIDDVKDQIKNPHFLPYQHDELKYEKN